MNRRSSIRFIINRQVQRYRDNTMPNKANQIVPPGNNETLKVMFDVMHFL